MYATRYAAKFTTCTLFYLFCYRKLSEKIYMPLCYGQYYSLPLYHNLKYTEQSGLLLEI